MNRLPNVRSKLLPSKMEALRMLGVECLGADLNPKLVEELFTHAFERVSEERPRQRRNIELFKRYWGFTDGKPVYLRQAADVFEISLTRVNEIVQGQTKRLLFDAVRERYKSMKRYLRLRRQTAHDGKSS